MNLPQLTSRAQTLRQQPVTPQTRTALEALRKEAAAGGVGAAFDQQLAALFRDVYGGKPPPPLSLTSMGGSATSAGAGGTKGGAVISFHAMRDPAAIEKSVAARVPALRTTVPTPIPLDVQFKPLSAAQKKDARNTLETQLKDVPVYVDGERTTLLDKLGRAGLDTDRLLDVLTMVQVGYERVEEGATQPPGYQLTNWKHTRLEVDRLLDVAKLGGLSPQETEVALYASFLSDAVKTPANFIVHNVHGAQAALHVLSRLVPPPSTEMIEDVVKATLEHQIGPPGFMGNAAMRKALNDAAVDKPLVDAICQKVAKPFDNLTADKTQVAFTDAEKGALAKAGLFAWTVPHEGSRHYKASRAVIDADSLVNYACPDGWAKLAELHGPDQPTFLQEPHFVDGLLSQKPQHASALKSFLDARAVVSPAAMPVYEQGRRRTEMAIDRVMKGLDRWLALQPQKDVPRTKDGKVPYLDGALDYLNGPQVAFARRVRAEGARLLRMEERIS